MLTRIAILEAQVNPAPEKHAGFVESIKNRLNGDYENMNPAIRKIFFMIAEFLGGKNSERLKKFLGEKGMKKLAEFYAKEFTLSAEKKDEVEKIHKNYLAHIGEKGNPDKIEMKNSRDIFDEKIIDFNVLAFQKALKNDSQ